MISKTDILLSILRLAREMPLDSISLSLVASECGITKSTLFSHFRSKDEMIDSLYSYMEAKLSENQKAAVMKGTPLKVLTAAVDSLHAMYNDEILNDCIRIIESQKLYDDRAKALSDSLFMMVKSQISVAIMVLDETGKLDIDSLDLAIDTFCCNVDHLLHLEMEEGDEDIQYMEDRFIESFISHYEKGAED